MRKITSPLDGYASPLSQDSFLRLFGYGSLPATLLGRNEKDGFAIDFTASEKRLLIRTTDGGANYLGPAFINDGGPVAFSRASLATVTDADGKVKWAPHNLLLASEQFGESQWTKGANVTLSTNASVSPDGTTTAERYSTSSGADLAANGISQGVSIGACTVTGGIWLRSSSSQTVQVRLLDGTTTITNSSVSVTSTWTLFTVAGSNTAAGATSLVIRPDGTNAISNLEIWGAHLYRSDLGGMVANTSAYPLYNPTTAKNLLGYTESFDNAAWVKSQTLAFGSGSVANAITAPNGLQTADFVVPNTTSSNSHSVYQSFTFTAAPTTVSVYAKAGGYGYFIISIYDGAHKTSVFNLTGGTVSQTASGGTATITDAGNGWYRCSIKLTTSAAAGFVYLGAVNAATWTYGTTTFAGDGVSGIYLWGAQLSDSASLDPYVANNFAAPSAAAYHGPRLDYSASGSPLGLLVEEQRTNVLLNSATLSTQSVTVTATAYTLSLWGTGTITLSGTSTAGPLVGTGANNRVTLTFTPTAGTLTLTVSGTVTQAQLEAGSFATSYIPTTSASVTRSADVAQVGTSAFPMNETEGTLVVACNFMSGSVATDQIAVQIDSGATTARHKISRFSAAIYGTTTNTTAQADMSLLATANAGDLVKAAYAYKVNDFAGTANGAAASTDTSGSLPTGLNTLRIGHNVGTVLANAYIRQITYIPRRLSNAELQSRTA